MCVCVCVCVCLDKDTSAYTAEFRGVKLEFCSDGMGWQLWVPGVMDTMYDICVSGGKEVPRDDVDLMVFC